MLPTPLPTALVPTALHRPARWASLHVMARRWWRVHVEQAPPHDGALRAAAHLLGYYKWPSAQRQ